VSALCPLTPSEAQLSPNVLYSLLLQATPAAPGPSSWMSFLPILLIFGIFYFLLFMPMQKQRKQTQKMLSSLQNGQTVVTSGGIVGTIVAIDGDETLVLRVKPDNIKIQVARSAVSSLVSSDVKK
jgi:preprotein translocase subunit YajC